MALVDLSKREIQCKIVYYGCGRCGKTTNLLYIHGAMNPDHRGKLLTINTTGERTLFFDLLPLSIGKIGGFDIRIQLYTVPGQVMYEVTRNLVLKGVDGLVFVADPLEIRRQRNIESLDDLRRNLVKHELDIEKMPLVMQYNKQDLLKAAIPTVSIEELEKDLNSELKAKTFSAAATDGVGVFETLKEISKLTVKAVAEKNMLHKIK
jgi:signal recognition particle receptor subunit beta